MLTAAVTCPMKCVRQYHRYHHQQHYHTQRQQDPLVFMNSCEEEEGEEEGEFWVALLWTPS